MEDKAEGKKIKVVTVIPGEENGNTMIFAKRQVKSLTGENIENKVFYLTRRNSISGLLAERKRLRKLIAEFKPALVHCHYGTITALLTVLSTGRPVIITFHGSDLNYTPSDGLLRDFFGRIFSNLAAIKAKKIICVSEQLSKKLWFHFTKTMVLPVGVDDDMFKPVDQSEARKKLNWGAADKVIIFNGANPKIKRLDLAMQVIEKVKETIPGARLEVMAGNVNPADVPMLLNASDCLLLCSDTEGSPTIIKEALACNLPVVATAVGDVSYQLEKVNGTMVVEREITTMANAILKIIDAGERCNGREALLQKELTEKAIARKLYLTYKKVAEENMALNY